MTSHRAGLQHRPEIDGLRAVAVLPVILFHAGMTPFAGGYVGVDVFFVISGYLITSIIHNEIRAGTFSIVRFYERRARRILPALFLVILVTFPFAWAWMQARPLENFGQSALAATLFSSNVLFWAEAGYFETTAGLKPLLHTWSLAVEEQFYILFPLLLIALAGLRARGLIAVILVLAAASLALAQWGSRAVPSAAFYLLPFRAWELGVGAIVALAAPAWSRAGGVPAALAAAAGVAAIALAVFAYDERTPFPSLWALAPVLGTAAVIAFARPTCPVGRVLSWKPIVAIGLVSYSAYLWHHPLFAFARIRSYHDGVTPLAYAALIALTFVLAALSWRFVEQPFRKGTAVSRGQVFAGAGVVGAALVGLGAVLHVGEGFPTRLPPAVAQYAAWSDDFSPYRDTCAVANAAAPETRHAACIHGEGSASPIQVWGDSHAIELAWRLSETLAPMGVPVEELTHFACLPLDGAEQPGAPPSCQIFRADVMRALTTAETAQPMVLLGRWVMAFTWAPFDNGEGGRDPLVARDSMPEALAAENERRLAATVQALLDAGRRVVLVYPIPEVGWDVPKYLQAEAQFGAVDDAPLSTDHQVYLARNAAAERALDAIGEHPGLVRVRPADLLCDTIVPGRCAAEIDGAPLYFDDDHLNSVGAGMLADAVVAAMQGKGWLPPAGEGVDMGSRSQQDGSQERHLAPDGP